MKQFIIFLTLVVGLQTYASNDKYRLSLRGNPATSIVVGLEIVKAQVNDSGLKQLLLIKVDCHL